ncbi:radical SAM family heme chaperone HemW [Halanaerobacter jeridensis]|uniref:Heme chaperone HemW n=1 Tax=Halanaerobacter jeridensis TaxID=706427 RepID=A0A938XR79_9FIRM|nr:radical SAM family heme chaperone HemW [Halanaerobacter jeridensis]MBM7556229.1 oxygen-independent coproporphyrinogen-3 oxidase [Halanaerobacter jeridensis]
MTEDYGLYIHIPFCAQKCHYCDFNSIAADDDLISRYLDALKKEIKLVADKYYSPQLQTIYIGGGTPSILSGQDLSTILNQCRQKFDLNSNLEITMEANPGTLSEEQLRLTKQAGVNRLSLGVQSFNNQFLTKLGRIHSKDDVITSYRLARELDFDNISFDLMFALPGQSLNQWENTLQQAIELGPEHISAYNLKIEPNTVFAQWLEEGKIEKISEELDLKMYRRTIELLEENNYYQYEISNFSQPGYNSRHNKIYWQNQEYLALGPGAHFYDGQFRGYNITDIKDYCHHLEAGQLAIAEQNKLSRVEKIEETLILGLRLNQGISLAEFKKKFNQSLTEIYEIEIQKLVGQDLINQSKGRLFLTDHGREIANQVLSSFILS